MKNFATALFSMILITGCGERDGEEDAPADGAPDAEPDDSGEADAPADSAQDGGEDAAGEDAADLEPEDEICTPSPQGETCNGLDDDCNGEIDDVPGLESDAANCGECGNDCTVRHPSAPAGSTEPACAAGSCAFRCLGDFYDANGEVGDGCECLDEERYTQEAPNDLGVMDDCDGVFFDVTAQLPHDGVHEPPFEEWYAFEYVTSAFCDIEFYLLFRSPAGTRMRVQLLDERGVAMGLVDSEGDVVKISEGNIQEGVTYNVVVSWLEGDSCEPYRLVMGDGCCSAECSFSCGTCNTGCPSL